MAGLRVMHHSKNRSQRSETSSKKYVMMGPLANGVLKMKYRVSE